MSESLDFILKELTYEELQIIQDALDLFMDGSSCVQEIIKIKKKIRDAIEIYHSELTYDD